MSRRPAGRAALVWIVLAGVPTLICSARAQQALQAPQTTSTASSASSSPIDLHNGVAVVAVGSDTADSAWALAGGVYGDALLRPNGLHDQTARVLAGESPPKDAIPSLRELAGVRAALKMDSPVAARLAGSITKELNVSALLLVYLNSAAQPRARLYVGTTQSFYSPDLWPRPDADGKPSWQSTVQWLRENSRASRPPATPKSPASRSIFASGWLWGAVGLAAGASILVYSLRRDESPSTIHLQGRVAP